MTNDHRNLGTALYDKGRIDEAIAAALEKHASRGR
jgi:hypothetical protein